MSHKSDAKYQAYLDTLTYEELRQESKSRLAKAERLHKSAGKWLLFSIIMFCVAGGVKISSMIWGF